MRRLLYPKIYATVVAREEETRTIMVRLDQTQMLIQLDLRWRNGYGPTGTIQPGRRLKIYRRTGQRSLNFRLVGS